MTFLVVSIGMKLLPESLHTTYFPEKKTGCAAFSLSYLRLFTEQFPFFFSCIWVQYIS